MLLMKKEKLTGQLCGKKNDINAIRSANRKQLVANT
jgi:hypothetical protein